MRERQILRAAAALVMMCGCATALVVGYHTEPVKSSWSGLTRKIWGQDYVSQVLTCNWDELDSASGSYCELFAGAEGNGDPYHVSVSTYPGDVEIGYGNRDGHVDHRWVRFNLHVYRPDSIIKGKKLTFRFTRNRYDSMA